MGSGAPFAWQKTGLWEVRKVFRRARKEEPRRVEYETESELRKCGDC
jgi:hypothetical protein